MRTTIVVILIVLAVIVGGLLRFRASAKTGMPPQDVLDRAARRARELEKQEKLEEKE